MKYEDYSKEVQAAIDRVACLAGVHHDEVVAAFVNAVKGAPVNLPSLFLGLSKRLKSIES